jgi:hypothetical protein
VQALLVSLSGLVLKVAEYTPEFRSNH